MSELMTSIVHPMGADGSQADGGLADYGRKSRAEMIKRYRLYAEDLKRRAEAILATADDDFIVEQFRGIHVRRNVVRIEPAEKKGGAA